MDTCLSELEQADPRAARVVELRFFGGLREEDVADVLQVSVITVKRDWKAARLARGAASVKPPRSARPLSNTFARVIRDVRPSR